MEENTLFWSQLCKACNDRNMKPNKVASEIGLSSSVMTSYKNGRIPSGDVLLRLSKYLGKSIDFFFSDVDADIDFNLNEKKNGTGFNTFRWLTQKWASIRFGDEISDEQMVSIAKFINCKLEFLYNSLPDTEFIPNDKRLYKIESLDALDIIIDVFDRVDNNNKIYELQMHLSHVVMYWLEKKGITGKELLSDEKYRSISPSKIKFLYKIETDNNLKREFKCGFNITDLNILREKTGLSLLYLFTGIGSLKDLYEETYTK